MQNIWFVPAGDGEAVKVDVVATRTEGTLMFCRPVSRQLHAKNA